MGRDRVDLGFGDPLEDLDLSEFKPRQAPVLRPSSGETGQAAQAAGFAHAFNVADGFEGPVAGAGHRGSAAGWKASGLPWRQR